MNNKKIDYNLPASMTLSDMIFTPVFRDLRFFDFTYQYYSVLKTRISLFENYTICIPDLHLTTYIVCDKSVLIKWIDPEQCNVKNGSVQKVSW